MTLEFDLASLNQKPNNWVESSIEYVGKGVAEFLDPKGKAWGPTSVIYDEYFNYKIEMDVEGFEPNLPMGLDRLLSSTPPRRNENGHLIISFPPPVTNPCVNLTVKTPNGIFTSTDVIAVGHGFSISREKGERHTLQFHVIISSFDTRITSLPKYWDIPLVNFLTLFAEYDSKFGQHPLRIYPDIEIPKGIPQEKVEIANFISTQKSKMILFEFEKEEGFIEALPDFNEKERKLLSKKIPSAITSVMVAKIGEHSIESEQVKQWFPLRILDILGFASGNEVSFPWIEFRDSKGRLVSRVHGLMGVQNPLFFKGQKRIDEIVNRGTGTLITLAFDNYFKLNEPFLSVVIRHVIKGGINAQTLEDKYGQFCRAFETLASKYHVNSQDQLIAQISSPYKDEINAILSDAKEELANVEKKMRLAKVYDQIAYLHAIISRLVSISLKEKSFGLSVCDLLNYFGFPDGITLNEFYAKKDPNKKKADWASTLSRYRGSAIHEGYFKLGQNISDKEEIVAIINHFHDILIRIILKELGYQGTYLSPFLFSSPPHSYDWVKTETTASQLGYK